MPTKRYKITNNNTGETKVIDWNGEAPPTSDDVSNYFKSVTPPNPNNQKDQYTGIRKYYEQIKDLAGRGFDKINQPLLPERDFGKNEDIYPFPASSSLGNVNVPSPGKIYDNVRDLSSPVGIASTILPFAHMLGAKPEVKPEEALYSEKPGQYEKVSELSKPLNQFSSVEETVPNVKPKFTEPEEATYNRVLAKKGGTQNSTALVKKYEPVGPPEPKQPDAPRLAGFQNSGTGTVYLQFDRNGVDVTPEHVRSMFPDKNIEVIKFRENLLSPHIQKFRIDTDSKTAQAMQDQIGGNFHDWDRAFRDKMGGSFSEVVGGQNQEPKDITPSNGGEPPKPPNGLSKYEPIGPNEPPNQKLLGGNSQREYGEFPQEWADYVNARKAANLEGQYKGKQYSYLDQDVEGLVKPGDEVNNHPINLLQQNLKEGNFPEVRAELDQIHKDLNEAGVDTNYKEDYLPQIWDNTPDEVTRAFGKRLGLKPSFTFESFFKDYQEGIDAGLTPKYNNPSELLNYYISYARKAIADRKFFDYLKDTDRIQTSKVGSDWKPLSGEYFPGPWKDRTYYAEPNTARLLNNYFSNPEQGSWGEIAVNNAANVSGRLTRTVLGFHLPGTAWSMHGINTSIAHSLFGEDLNPLKAVGRLGESAYYLSRPQQAEEFLNNNPASAINAVKDGGLAIDRWSSDIGKPLISGDSLAAKGLNFLTDPKPLFQQFIPSMMLKAYERELNELQRKGLSYKDAAQRAGYNVNNVFGVLNREASTNPLVYDKTINNIKRTFLLAPNWLESRLGLTKGTAQALLNPNDPRGKKYLSGVSNFIASYAALNVLNMLSNDGKTMLQNQPGKELSLAVGKDSKGKTIYVNPYAGAIDFIKVPLDIAHSALEGDFSETTKDLRSRASEPTQFAVDLLSNTDWKQSPILGNKGNYGRSQSIYDQVGNLANDTASHFLPLGIEGGINALEGKISPEEAAARVLQLPMSFKSENSTGRRRSQFAPIGPRIPSAP